MNRINLKKLLILNIPYILVGLFATNFGEAWRLAEGADSSAKILGFFNALPIALGNPIPSFHPMDLLIGIACGAGLRLAVYLKSKTPRSIGTMWSMVLPVGVQPKTLSRSLPQSLRITSS